jgi:tagatose 1,6-diphosphate aldolase GatY/KbaY
VIAPFAEILAAERAAGRAAGAFTCYDLATAAGVLRAAGEANVPVILLVSRAAFVGDDGELLGAGLVAAAAGSPTAACVQLDHVGELERIARAVALGFGAVMADGSHLPFEENAEFVREAAAIARGHGAAVEAELGHIEGGEDVAAAVSAGALTDPEEAERFVDLAAVDCLAVSIGNVHGAYAEPPDLDWPRLAAIRERVSVPLSLHGASGLSVEDVGAAVAAGIAKVNVNAELRRRAFQELTARLPELEPGYRLLELQEALATAAAEVAGETIRMLAGPATLDL